MEQKQRDELNRMRFKNIKPKAINLEQEPVVKTSYLLEDRRLPLVVQPAVDDVNLIGWAKDNREFIETELQKHGALLFRGFKVDSVAEFEGFATSICPDLFGEYGDLPREEEGGKVYSSTPYPPDKTILFHNESSHMHSWPMKQFFYCVKAAKQGGETPLVDCRAVYERIDPQVREEFARKQLMYVRNFTESLDVSWQNFFKTEDRSDVEEYCRKAGIDFEWTAGNGLRTRKIGPAVMRHPKTDQLIFFNQIQLYHTLCLDADVRKSLLTLFKEEDLPRNIYYGDGSRIEDDVVHKISEIYWQTAVIAPWQEQDIILVDNMLVAHARRPFVGPRKIVVAMGEMYRAGT